MQVESRPQLATYVCRSEVVTSFMTNYVFGFIILLKTYYNIHKSIDTSMKVRHPILVN